MHNDKNITSPGSVALRILLICALCLHGCGGGGAGDGSTPLVAGFPAGYPDTFRPVVSDTSPAIAEAGVSLNTSITVTFSEPMNNGTLNGTTFNLKRTTGNVPVGGTVSVNSSAATFVPSAPLAPNTQYTATVTTDVRDVAGNALAAAYTWGFTTGVSLDTTRPAVTSTAPTNNSTNIATNAAVSATFSEAMTNSTLNSTNFSVVTDPGSAPVNGTTSVSGNTVTFTPFAALTSATRYRATILTGVADAAGNTLATNYIWRFTTAAAPDTTPPTVTIISPVDGATGVAINSTISATFSEAMTGSTLTNVNFNLRRTSGQVVGGTVSMIGNTARFTPSASLLSNTGYLATITTDVKDSAGNALETNFTWDFTTAAAPDTTPPTVVSVAPTNGTTGVALGASVSATFSELMTNSTLSTSNFTVRPTSGGSLLSGTIAVNDKTATFTPAADLAPNTQYTAAIGTGARDAAGNSLAALFNWNFTSAAAVVTPGTAVLSWDVVTHPNLAGYLVYYGTSSGIYFQAVGDGLPAGTTPSYTVTGLNPGERYYFAVTAYDSSGLESGYSNEVFKDIQ